ncbi:MAG: response regulator [Proteobacteria bacterium]|nr:MAG: response regulator [Pseudomonadota bacterium]
MGHKILVVDDSSTIRKQISVYLKRADFSVIEAFTGEDGLNKLKANPDVSLIVTDVKMPNMGGFEMVEAIREIPQFQKIPVVMLTTEGGKDEIQKGKALGVLAWHVKPFSEKLIDNIKHILDVAPAT